MHPLASAGPFDRAQGRLILEGVVPANLREGHALPTDFGHGCRFDDLGDLYYYYLANQILGQLAKNLPRRHKGTKPCFIFPLWQDLPAWFRLSR